MRKKSNKKKKNLKLNTEKEKFMFIDRDKNTKNVGNEKKK